MSRNSSEFLHFAVHFARLLYGQPWTRIPQSAYYFLPRSQNKKNTGTWVLRRVIVSRRRIVEPMGIIYFHFYRRAPKKKVEKCTLWMSCRVLCALWRLIARDIASEVHARLAANIQHPASATSRSYNAQAKAIGVEITCISCLWGKWRVCDGLYYLCKHTISYMHLTRLGVLQTSLVKCGQHAMGVVYR